MNFFPNRVRINYGKCDMDLLEINELSEVVSKNLRVTFNVNNDSVITPIITAFEDIAPEWLNIEFDIPQEALDDNFYYYYSAFTTNDITSVFRHTQKPKNDMKDLFVALGLYFVFC